ncbi:helix-turn-helix domain-containing protein [Glycomyces sp. L485]|uniref:helix-turn-helix domain-containing protein n=1 Tax=Glycomyces sp. L485 TaxID=2909235 RepID=UPI001F4ACC59|nr:helix-turn-helix domain-containing protein [Glycomyces sp. L485]
MPFGARLKYYRNRAGKTREVLGGLLGKSGSWVKAVETGRLQMPRLQTLLKIAEVLNIRDVADLVGDQPLPIESFRGPGHPALTAVRKAVNNFALAEPHEVNLAHLRLRLADAWRVRHASANHRTALGELLPGLITEAQAATTTADLAERREAYAILAEVMNLAQMFAAYQPDGNLLWRIAERGMMAAQESGDRAVIASAVWFMCQVHRDAGQWDDSADVIDGALRMLEPRLPDAQTAELSMYGALSFEAAYTAARAGEAGQAWRMWDRADDVASRLPELHYHPQTSFSRAIIGAHAVTAAVELAQPGTALQYARRTDPAAIPSNPRRSRHLVEVARAQHAQGQFAEALATLHDAQRTAPETVRYNGFARRMTLQLLEGPKPLRQSASELAAAVGLVD